MEHDERPRAAERGVLRMASANQPLLVAGMHRSGTSLVASYLVRGGFDFGKRLIAADARNQRGYFEDADVVEFHGRALRACTRPDENGHRDWGWTESEHFDGSALDAFRDEATALAGRHLGDRVPWGWKDPRTTVLLDFWDTLLPDARYLLVYRFPWEVADSLQRIQADVFLDHPDYAYRIWAFYNRRLLAFHRAHRDRTLLVSADAMARNPRTLRTQLVDKLSIRLPEAAFNGAFDAQLFASVAGDDPLIPLVEMAFPDTIELLRELDDAAELSSAAIWESKPRNARAPQTAPVLSVVTPCRDHGNLLIEAIASVERDPTPTELILVNDGSTEPRTLRLLGALRRSGYHVVDQPFPTGLPAARNRGIEVATTPYLLPLDADNRLRPGFIASAVEFLDREPDVDVLYGDRYEFGKRSGTVVVPEFSVDQLLESNYIDACAVFRRKVWVEVGGYDPRLPFFEDWDLWLSAIERGFRFHHRAAAPFDYRVRPRSLSVDFTEASDERRTRVVDYVAAKHRELYRSRLPWLTGRAREGHLPQILALLGAEPPEGEQIPLLPLSPSWPEAPTDPILRVAWLEGRVIALERALSRRSRQIRALQEHACLDDLRRMQRVDDGLAPVEDAGSVDDLDDRPVVQKADLEACITELWKSAKRP